MEQITNLVQPIAGDTDSLYISYENLIKTIVNLDGSELTPEQKIDFLVKLNTEFLDQHNTEYMRDFYRPRHSLQMVQKFELETIAWRDIRLAVKKRYAQLLIWKDGKRFDMDKPKFKSKGLEVIKASYPEMARKGLERVLKELLATDKTGMDLTHHMNQLVQQEKQKWLTAPIEDLCENKGISNYTKYILSDNNPMGLEVAPKCPYHVRALGNRNWAIQTKGEHGELQYGGKMKIYLVKKQTRKKTEQDNYFAFMAGEYPAWAEKYFPCDREGCFAKFFLDPLNRVLESTDSMQLQVSGNLDLGIFD